MCVLWGRMILQSKGMLFWEKEGKKKGREEGDKKDN
jgi:hypothetical protein